ncbi:MAG: prephenate dehydratase [Methanomassiliicoccaceae archaeon]|jgi:prephenate dehydratase|nr:prephenate dehydratase [Euryarchaeota archaeon]HOB38602.1 prephenate dehydratase [Methanomassiliicoccaceae archaeon]HQA20248.1 prephenate dehydratase [Methanomassiliicoccaceae archaeon]HQD87276.1 prephenate dehydratase [Methanomassiliicoccaceae archaeon]
MSGSSADIGLVAFQGERGAFSEDAAVRFFGEVDTLPCPDFESVFRAVDEGRASRAVVPVENSVEGSVTAVNDLLLENDLVIVGEVMVKVAHCLIGRNSSGIDRIRRVYSHPQALGQCRRFLAKHPLWEKVPSFDTAGSVRMVRDRGLPDEAAIASRRAAEVYGMDILLENIQDSDDNCTRFFVLQKTQRLLDKGDKTSLVFATRSGPGALYEALGCFASRGINMTKVESRPRRGRAWEYAFFLDIDGHADEPNVADALADLVRRAVFVKVLGTYERAKPIDR